MSDEPPKGVIQIESKLADGSEPACVSVYIDGDPRFTVRTSDLENIGAQLRGKSRFSAFNSIVMPIMISLLTVIGTTIVGQVFQYVSWRNSNALQTATARTERARETFQKASLALSKRYYATLLFLGAATDLANLKGADSKLYKLNNELDQQRFNGFYAQLKSWNDDYDQNLTSIDYNLDGPVLHKHEHVSIANFYNKDDKAKNIDCSQMLLTELARLKLNVDSIKVQFAALNYCFANSISDFSNAKNNAVIGNDTISNDVKNSASQLNESVRQMSDEFRCYAQHYIIYLGQQKQASIFRPTTWIYDWSAGALLKLFVSPPNLLPSYLTQTRQDCDPSANSSQG